MKAKRKQYSSGFKAKVALESFKDKKAFFERYNYRNYHQGIARQLPVAVCYDSLASTA